VPQGNAPGAVVCRVVVVVAVQCLGGQILVFEWSKVAPPSEWQNTEFVPSHEHGREGIHFITVAVAVGSISRHSPLIGIISRSLLLLRLLMQSQSLFLQNVHGIAQQNRICVAFIGIVIVAVAVVSSSIRLWRLLKVVFQQFVNDRAKQGMVAHAIAQGPVGEVLSSYGIPFDEFRQGNFHQKGRGRIAEIVLVDDSLEEWRVARNAFDAHATAAIGRRFEHSGVIVVIVLIIVVANDTSDGVF
jgi:hypothetical protein